MSLIPVFELLQHSKEAVKIPSGIANVNLLCLNRVVLSVKQVSDIQDDTIRENISKLCWLKQKASSDYDNGWRKGAGGPKFIEITKP